MTWLDWGSTVGSVPTPRAVLLFRNQLPSADFHHAVQIAPPGGTPASARQAMGPYYPEATYCAKRVFERGGPAACFA